MQTMTDRFCDIKKNILHDAEIDPAIKAVIAIGSTTRQTVKADEYSDLDLIIVTDDPQRWYSGEYPAKFGEISIAFIEPTLGGGKEYRMIYEEHKDVDMILFTPEQFTNAVKMGVAQWVMNRGYHILYDQAGYSKMIGEYVKSSVSHPRMSQEEFINMTNDFYFHNIWAAKKLMRGELWSAKMCVDVYQKNYLLRMIELYCHQTGGKDVWHDGRFLDRWADAWILDKLKSCYAHYEKEDVQNALIHTHELFSELATAVAAKNEFPYPRKAEITAKEFLEKL